MSKSLLFKLVLLVDSNQYLQRSSWVEILTALRLVQNEEELKDTVLLDSDATDHIFNSRNRFIEQCALPPLQEITGIRRHSLCHEFLIPASYLIIQLSLIYFASSDM